MHVTFVWRGIAVLFFFFQAIVKLVSEGVLEKVKHSFRLSQNCLAEKPTPSKEGETQRKVGGTSGARQQVRRGGCGSETKWFLYRSVFFGAAVVFSECRFRWITRTEAENFLGYHIICASDEDKGLSWNSVGSAKARLKILEKEEAVNFLRVNHTSLAINAIGYLYYHIM